MTRMLPAVLLAAVTFAVLPAHAVVVDLCVNYEGREIICAPYRDI